VHGALDLLAGAGRVFAGHWSFSLFIGSAVKLPRQHFVPDEGSVGTRSGLPS